MSYKERRRFTRHDLVNQLEYQSTPGGHFERTKTVDVSEGGLMFTSRREFAPGAIIDLNMPLDGRFFKVKARVAQVHKDENTDLYKIGVAFVEYSEAFKTNLKLKLVNVIIVMTFFSSMFSGAPKAHASTQLLENKETVTAELVDKRSFLERYSDEALTKFSLDGGKHISICVTHYLDRNGSTDIKRTDRTPSDRDVTRVIKKAHKLGLKVMLKPQVDIIDNFDGIYTRSDIGFSSEADWQKWFDEYKSFIRHYARIANRLGVDIFCVGTELSFTTQRDDKWKEVIASVRRDYKGSLVYAASRENFKYIRFWEDLDYVGIESSVPTAKGVSELSVEDLKKAWGEWHYEIEAWQAFIKKPVLFTNRMF